MNQLEALTQILEWEHQINCLYLGSYPQWLKGILKRMTKGILTRMVDCDFASQIWTKLKFVLLPKPEQKVSAIQDHASKHQVRLT